MTISSTSAIDRRAILGALCLHPSHNKQLNKLTASCELIAR